MRFSKLGHQENQGFAPSSNLITCRIVQIERLHLAKDSLEKVMKNPPSKMVEKHTDSSRKAHITPLLNYRIIDPEIMMQIDRGNSGSIRLLHEL